jgi:hypothetical protein
MSDAEHPAARQLRGPDRSGKYSSLTARVTVTQNRSSQAFRVQTTESERAAHLHKVVKKLEIDSAGVEPASR